MKQLMSVHVGLCFRQMLYTFWMTNRWLLLNFDTLGGIAVLVTTLFSIATLTDGAGWAGVCITSAMAFTMSGKLVRLSSRKNALNEYISVLGVPVLDG